MPAPIPLEEHKQQVNVRFDAATRQALEAHAVASDRTISQLVRYATAWWLSSPSRTCPAAPADPETPGSRHVNVRFAPHVIQAIITAAEEMDSDRSAVIRCAVRAWLDSVSVDALGHPSIAARPMATAV